MTASPPLLFDRARLAQARARAGSAPFLHERAAIEIEERLALVNRTFTRPAIVTGFPDLWRARFPAARIVADDEVLDLAPGAHDLVVHGLALHWANDPVGQLVQCRRALAPDGLCLAIALGGQTLAELRACLAEAEVRLTGGLSPRVAPMADVRALGQLLQRAGFALPVADVDTLRASYADALALMRDLRAMGETNALAARRRGFTRRALLAEAARIYAESFPAGDGRIAASFDFVVLTGWAPAESQPKPLRPGSARMRLADALRPAAPPRDDPPPDDPPRDPSPDAPLTPPAGGLSRR
jgi:SAM-dependent methyltransferase